MAEDVTKMDIPERRVTNRTLPQKSDSATICPVCSEDYTETGDKVPKILPCKHSLCEKCASVKLFKDSDCRLECPVCGDSHAITGGVDFIPENSRILDRIRSKRLLQESSRRCEEHGSEKGLYCYRCNVCLCALCLDKHPLCKYEMCCVQDYKVIASRWKEILETDKEDLIQARKENEEKSNSCTEQITIEKERILKEITEVFDDFLKKVSEDKKKMTLILKTCC